MSEVTVLPATKKFFQTADTLERSKGVRVAAYCRVSTDEEDQENSYQNQVAYYKQYIAEQKDWIFAGIYADDGISGMSTKGRDGFKQMLADAKAGMFDYIITKSISRFTRNTVDGLTIVNELLHQDPPVGVYFQKENLDTMQKGVEFLLTIMTGIAQSESDSTGENITWTIRRKFAAGDPLVNPNRIYGYRKGEDGSWEIDPKQGKVVQFIYQKYREGWASRNIAKDLMERNVPAPGGKVWYPTTVIQLIKNEKYKGDVRMQKTITVDRKNKICKKNEGEAKSYYIKDHHVPIVSRELWDECNQITKDREAARLENFEKNRAKPPFSLLKLLQDKDFYKSHNERAVKDYEDERGEGHYYFKRNFLKKHSTGDKWYAFTVEQSFMEMLYACKEDFETYGDGSDIAMDFNEKYDAARLSQAPQDEIDQMKEEYQAFLKALLELPTTTQNGRPLMVNGVNAQGTLMRTVEGYVIPGAYSMVKHGKIRVTDDKIQKTPDILPFDRAFAERYFTKMDLIGDEAEYTTRFGVKLKSIRNQRTLNAFMGYRKFDEQGNASLVMEEYQVVLDRPMFREK